MWSQQDILVTPPVLTSDFLYLRLIGDRSINEKDFGKKKDRTNEMQLWSNIIIYYEVPTENQKREQVKRKFKDFVLSIISRTN